MATVNLVPNADVSNSPAWTLSGGSDVYPLIAAEASVDESSDSDKISATAAGKKCIVEFTDLDFSGLNIDSINSVQAVVRAIVPERAQTYTMGVRILDSSSTELWAQETSAGSSAGNWATHTFTARTTDGTDAWVDDDSGNSNDIDGIRMEIEGVAMSGGTLKVGYAYFIIDYDEIVIVIPKSLTINGVATINGQLTIK